MTGVSFSCAIRSNVLGTILFELFTIQTAPVAGYDILLPVTEHIYQMTCLFVGGTSPRVGRFQYVTQVVIAALLACVTCRRRCWMEFFLNVCTEFKEFNDKNICHYRKRVWGHLLYKRPRYYHNTSKTHVRDRILKLTPIHASVIYLISESAEVIGFNKSSAPFRKSSIIQGVVMTSQ